MRSEKFVPKGKRFVDNLAPNVSPAYLGNVFSGRTVTLSGDGKIDVPINATLEEKYNGITIIDRDEISVVDNGDGTITGTLESGGTSGYFYIRLSKTGYNGALTEDIPAGAPVEVQWSIMGNSGEIFTEASGWGIAKEIVVNGEMVTRKLECIASGDTADYVRIEVDGTEGDSVTVDANSISIKEIKSTQGQITYWDATQKKHVSINGSNP